MAIEVGFKLWNMAVTVETVISIWRLLIDCNREKQDEKKKLISVEGMWH